MMDWLLGHRSSLPLVLVVYMTLHVLARLFVSPVLDFDESEQVFLSQWFALGYNNQPPMYTWTQMGVFALMGCSVFSLTLLKNLHLFGTYLLTYGAVRTTTEDSRPATIAAVGMLTIPQIAWESHRDLTHTVGATFFVALLIYAVVRLAAKPHWCWYGLVGLATGMGMLSKYNFSLVILGVFVAAISLPRYRALILDRRIYLTISIAIALVVPHAVWMADHIGLATSRTLKSMTADASSQWLMNVAMGGFALVSCILGCLAFTLALFGLLWREGRADQISSGSDGLEFSDDDLQLGRLMERILVVIFGVLLLMVLSGSTTEFKNRWLQPFIFFRSGLFGPQVSVSFTTSGTEENCGDRIDRDDDRTRRGHLPSDVEQGWQETERTQSRLQAARGGIGNEPNVGDATEADHRVRYAGRGKPPIAASQDAGAIG